MAWLSILTLFAALSLTGLLPSANSVFEGCVITESGSPLQGVGVLLVSKSGSEIEVGNFVSTDDAGTFHLKRIPDALFVKKEGYLPQLYRVETTNQKPLIVMHPVIPAKTWPIEPVCFEAKPGQQFVRIGQGFGIMIGEELSVEPNHEQKSGFAEIAYRKSLQERMTISWAGLGIIGYPHIDALARTSEIVVHAGGRDISGTTADGKHWRWMFGGASHIEYYDVSEEGAHVLVAAYLTGNKKASSGRRSSHGKSSTATRADFNFNELVREVAFAGGTASNKLPSAYRKN
jgi:hypothetical protein